MTVMTVTISLRRLRLKSRRHLCPRAHPRLRLRPLLLLPLLLLLLLHRYLLLQPNYSKRRFK